MSTASLRSKASVGVHVAKVSHILDTPFKNRKTMLEAIKVDCGDANLKSCQIFVQGPMNSHMAKMDAPAIKQYCDENKINLYVHSSYLTVGCWNINNETKNTAKGKNAIESLKKQLAICDQLNSKGFVVHLSKKTPEQVIETLGILYPAIKNYKTPFILEQPAKKPDGDLTYETVEKTNKLTKLIVSKFPKFNFGWCIDTCHLWSGGIRLDEAKVAKAYFNDLMHKYIKLIHINGGSSDIFNTGKDRHIIPFSKPDDIFSINKQNINHICSFAKKNYVDMILEVNRGNPTEVKLAIQYLNKLL